MNNKFVHLHTHSHFSLLDGLTSPKDLVKYAKEQGFTSLALTDHGSVGGLYRFQKECKEANIKPILGMEGYSTANHLEKGDKTYHIILLVKNEIGLKNLMRLATIAELDGKYRKPRIDFSLLEKYHEGLICTSACPAGEISSLISSDKLIEAKEVLVKYKKLFQDDFYIEVMRHKYFSNKKQEESEQFLSLELYKLAKEFDVKIIATNDIHYCKKSDQKYHDILLAMQTKTVIKNPDRFTFDSDDFYMKSHDEMLELFKDMPEAISNTLEVAEKIECGLFKPSADLLPCINIPSEFKDESDYLKTLVKDGMAAKGFLNKPEYRERIKFEMQVIIKCGYVRYFLVLWDIINWAKTNNIAVGVGRGSAVGSLALYVLGITGADPIQYDLLFERFLNPDRISPPDVDIDFDDTRRDEVIEYCRSKYGADHCCKIGTYQSMKARQIVRYVVKALDLGCDWEVYQNEIKKNPSYKLDESKKSLKLSDVIAKQVPEGPNVTIETAYKDSEDFRKSVDRYPGLLEILKSMEKTISSSGVHASGYIVCKNPIHNHVALRNNKDQICCQFEGPEVEELGLLKFDFLGLKTLTVLTNTTSDIKKRHDVEIVLEKLEPNDKNVFSLFNGKIRGMDNRGIFQFESYGMTKLLKDIRVDSFEDLVVSNALYRPGPLGAGIHTLYADYKLGRKPIKPLHPKMGEILKSTYSLMVFQESFMKVARELAGYSRGDSDVLRKCVGKKKLEQLKQQKDKFVQGCINNNIDVKIAEQIFDQIEYFGGYGFNRSHSVAYGLIGYYCAFMKIYYPLEYMCNLLTSEIDDEDKTNEYLKQATEMGIVVIKPNINTSGLQYKIEKGKNKEGKEYEFIRMPFTSLKGVGDKSVSEIILHQPYKDMKDFMSKINATNVNVRVFETLVDSGCMDAIWGMSRDEMKNQYAQLRKEIKKENDSKKKYEKEMEQYGGSLFDKIGLDIF